MSEGSPARITRPRIAAALLLVMSVLLAALAASYRAQLAEERDERNDIERVATATAAALLTYDFRDLDGWRARVLTHATPSYRAAFERTEPTLRAGVGEASATSDATITGVFAGRVGGAATTVVVTADSKLQTAAGERTTSGAYLRLDLVRRDGNWLVDNITNVNLGQSGNG